MISEEQGVSLATRKTKGAKGGGTIRQRPDGRWEARYTLGIDPGTGKQIQKSVYGKTQKEVRQKLTAITAEIDSGVYQEPCKMTVNEWLDIWLKDYQIGVKDSTAYCVRTKVPSESILPRETRSRRKNSKAAVRMEGSTDRRSGSLSGSHPYAGRNTS